MLTQYLTVKTLHDFGPSTKSKLNVIIASFRLRSYVCHFFPLVFLFHLSIYVRVACFCFSATTPTSGLLDYPSGRCRSSRSSHDYQQRRRQTQSTPSSPTMRHGGSRRSLAQAQAQCTCMTPEQFDILHRYQGRGRSFNVYIVLYCWLCCSRFSFHILFIRCSNEYYIFLKNALRIEIVIS